VNRPLSPDQTGAVRAQAAGSKARVLAVSRDVLGPLATVGSFATPPRGQWSTCRDLGHQALYHVIARLDPPPTAAGLAEVVRTRLRSAGLALRTMSEDPLTSEGEQDGVTVQITGYRTETMVLFDIWGPCLDVGAVDDELLDEQPVQLEMG
jgi:hypothetical protein